MAVRRNGQIIAEVHHRGIGRFDEQVEATAVAAGSIAEHFPQLGRAARRAGNVERTIAEVPALTT